MRLRRHGDITAFVSSYQPRHGEQNEIGLGLRQGADAFKRWAAPAGRKRLRRRSKAEKVAAAAERTGASPHDYAPSDVARLEHLPRPPFWGARVLGPEQLSLPEIFGYINKRALFRGCEDEDSLAHGDGNGVGRAGPCGAVRH
jgi:hypothetical protein